MNSSVVAVSLRTSWIIDALYDLGILPALTFAAVILEFFLIKFELVCNVVFFFDP